MSTLQRILKLIEQLLVDLLAHVGHTSKCNRSARKRDVYNPPSNTLPSQVRSRTLMISCKWEKVLLRASANKNAVVQHSPTCIRLPTLRVRNTLGLSVRIRIVYLAWRASGNKV